MTEVKVVTMTEAELEERFERCASRGAEKALHKFLQGAKKFDPAKYGPVMCRKDVATELGCSIDTVDKLLADGKLTRQGNGKRVWVTTESFINHLFQKK